MNDESQISWQEIGCAPLGLAEGGAPAALERKDHALQNQQKMAGQTREGAIESSQFRHWPSTSRRNLLPRSSEQPLSPFVVQARESADLCPDTRRVFRSTPPQPASLSSPKTRARQPHAVRPCFASRERSREGLRFFRVRRFELILAAKDRRSHRNPLQFDS